MQCVRPGLWPGDLHPGSTGLQPTLAGGGASTAPWVGSLALPCPPPLNLEEQQVSARTSGIAVLNG
jgi:hypothetical protein